jgi:exosortase/archaeosortase family protein
MDGPNAPIKQDVGLLKGLRESMPRDELFAGLCILGCANGLGAQVIKSVNDLGWESAVVHTFGISAIIWIACFLSVTLILYDRTDVLRSTDLVVGAAVIVFVLVPIRGASWLALTWLALYILLFTNGPSSRRRGASLILATTVPMLWTGLLLHFFAKPILEIDASMIGWLLGTDRVGNMVRFADNSGYLVIFPACSSLAGMSIAMLCWVTLSQAVRHRPSAHDLVWCGLACASVIVVNVGRISIMGLSERDYQAAHSPFGGTIANVVTLVLIVGFSLLGVRRELFSRI